MANDGLYIRKAVCSIRRMSGILTCAMLQVITQGLIDIYGITADIMHQNADIQPFRPSSTK